MRRVRPEVKKVEAMGGIAQGNNSSRVHTTVYNSVVTLVAFHNVEG